MLSEPEAPRSRTLKSARAMATNASAILKGSMTGEITLAEVREAAGLYRSAANLIDPPRPGIRSVHASSIEDARDEIVRAAESGELSARYPEQPEAGTPGDD